MTTLNTRERELVAIGAALGSNCIPCIEFHIPAARKAGLTDAEIAEAIELADKIKRVPADKVLDAASRRLSTPKDDQPAAPNACCTPKTDAKACC